MATSPDDFATGVGIDQGTKQPVEQYDKQLGVHKTTWGSQSLNLPNAGASASDPSPFKVGGTK